MNTCRYFLINFCNPKSGAWWWPLVEIIGWIIIFVWAFFALPVIGQIAHINILGKYVCDSLVAYGGLFTIPGNWSNAYVFSVIFATLFAKIGNLLQMIGKNYGNEFVYISPGISKTSQGIWVKRMIR